MAASDRARAALNYLKSLLTNSWFYAGLAILATIGVSGCLVFSSLIMPSYTRHGDNISVPDVRELNVDDARKALEAANLRVEVEPVRRLRPNVPVNTVVDQNPNPSTPVKEGRRVYIVVNSGSIEMVRVPDVISYAQREAGNRIVAAGLNPEFRRDPIPSTAPGTVTRLDPPAGTAIKQGETVTVYYSGGQSDKHVTIPDVRGMTVDQAREALLKLNIRSINTDAGNPAADTVRRQGGEPGTRVREGYELRLYTREAPPTPDENASGN
ncbi:MAG: PASTA domain-containing protein [Bacteroidetes bacterium]|nr:PASTA domain-containing protein [Bacteroidota bacterium]